jgi:hypothetical protein
MNECKKYLSECFLTDSRDFLSRYIQLEENATHIGLRTKLVVELMFSLECALKSLFIIETDLSEKEAYKKIKIEFKHDIEKIVSNLTEQSKKLFREKVTIDYKNFKVFQRYIFESEMAFREEFGTLGQNYYDTINNPVWLKSFYFQIKSFLEHVESKNQFELKTILFSNINIETELLKFKKLNEMLN